MSQIVWRQVNESPFEYAIQQGPVGDEFVKLIDGSCLRRDLMWQPIETAPKDPTQKERLLGFDPRYGIRIIRCDGWDPDSGIFEIALDGIDLGEDGSYPHDYLPTHWMLLPEPPGADKDPS